MSAPINLHEFEALAKAVLDPMVYGYYASGANDEVTLRENRNAFERYFLRPRMLRGASERDLTTQFLGNRYRTPVFIAPMALQRMAHPEGEIAVARAGSKYGATMVLSTMSSIPLEDVAQASSAEAWFQLYVYKDRSVVKDIVQRAEESGYRVLVLTIDTPLLGRREADIRNQFHLPHGIKAANLKESYFGDLDKSQGDSALAKYWREVLREGGLTWKDVDWLASITQMPIVLKGIMRGDDAQIALEHGVKGLIVSNHGGRQLDTAHATIDVLEEVVHAVAGKADVMLDGGIRRGSDVLKGLALGAKAVMVGRPLLWGLAYNGQAGVELALQLLLDEIDLAMALCGCRRISDITRDLITTPRG